MVGPPTAEDENEDFPGRLLHQAALWGNAELLEDLLHGDMLQFLNAKDSHGRTALHAAATNESETCTRILLQAGADPNIACGLKEQYKTSLHLAAENGQLAIARLLLDHDADVLARDSSGLTAMDLAEKADQPHLMELLREAADNREQHREDLHIALWEACSKGDASKAKQLLKHLGRETELIINSTPNGCNTLLFKACEEGQKEIVKLLLENGADGRIHPVTKYSPLYIACYYGRKDIAEILIRKFPELVVASTVEKWLPLHAAVINGHMPVLELLLRFPYDPPLFQKYMDKTQKWEYYFPFDINAKDVTEQTVLYVACLVGNQRIVDLLLKFRVPAKRVKTDEVNDEVNKEIGFKSQLNISPTKKRLSNGIQNMISRLSLRNNAETEQERTETEISPIDLDLYCNNSTETALHIAVKNKHHNIVSQLLQNGCNPNLSIKQSVEELNRGNETPSSTSTALVEACKNRDVNMVDSLVRYGARDDNCKALKVASSNKDELIASKLLTLKAYQDPEFKINKKALEIVPSTHLGGLLGSVTFSSMFPTTAVMINWHGQKCLHYIREEWLISASMAHNVKLKLTPRNQSTALMAITRLDISNNQLTEVPLCIFQMASLRHLNAAQNKIFKLPEAEWTSSSSPKNKRETRPVTQSGWCCPVLEEIHLHDNRLDSVPPCLFSLPSLTVLDLSNNKLQALPFKMWSSPKLRELNLSLNMLHDLPSRPPPARSVSASRLAPSISEDMGNTSDASPRHSTPENSSLEGSCEIPNLLSPVVDDSKVDGDLRQQELVHHNFWSGTVKIVESSNDNETDKNQKCQLAALNLAHNAYELVPPILSCFAVNLARLNMSYNRLTEMGPVSSYPGCLKHLDLSHNHIRSWLSLRRADPDVSTDGGGCYSQWDVCVTKPKTPSVSSTGRTPSPSLHSWGSAKSLSGSGSCCQHRRHTRLDNLRTLILADNQLDRLLLILDEDDFEEEDSKSSESFETIDASGKVVQPEPKIKILFPNLSMLDVSNNNISDVPIVISEFNNLSVLNLSGNKGICHLPPEMGLLSKLWNLNTRMCNLSEPLRSMIDSKKYKTMDVIGYLKSILEDAKPYARMKLMIVGIEGIGKTSLLEQLRLEGTGNYRKKPPEHWAKRMGNKNVNVKTPKGINISTVGVDVGDWIYEKKVRGQSSYGPVVFRTWDFGGQKEYYATHQYFLSKRSLYLVTWRIIDGERGVDSILQWLVNIQARAPNAPVIIVGTHYDLVKERFPPCYSEDLQQMIRERFINVVDADKCGLPRVIDTIEISCKTRHNIKLLCNLVYDTVFELKCPGSKERLLEQKIPATYLALEDVVGLLAVERHVQGKDPVLRVEPYRNLVMQEMMQRYNIAFRDLSELNQATTFLHENGILLHYEDATLKDLYFLDPQWLCDMLAHVVTIREINPFARNGIMKIEDLKHVFKSSQFAPSDAQTYILNLLNKFEVALTWDNRTLIIPSLLPTEEQLRAGFPGCDVRVPVRSRVWAMRKSYSNRHSLGTTPLTLKLTTTEKRPQRPHSELPLTGESISAPKVTDPLEKEADNSTPATTCYVRHKTQIESVVRRLLLMSYFPSGFWSRLMTRMLADDIVVEIIRSYYLLPKDVDMDPLLAAVFNRRAEWICWQTGMELRYLDTTLFRMKEHLSHLNNAPFEYRQMKLFVQQEGSWGDIEIVNSAILEIILPNQTVVVQTPKVDAEGAVVAYDSVELQPNGECVAKLLSVAVDHIDTLLEDWYPTLGTRFVHTSEGKFLVTRLIPCTQCVVTHIKEETSNGDKGHFSVMDHAWEPGPWLFGDIQWKGGIDPWPRTKMSHSPNMAQRNRGSRNSNMSHDSDSGVGPDSNSSSRKPSTESRPEGDLTSSNENTSGNDTLPETVIYSFMVEECILTAYEQRSVQCPLHGNQSLLQIAPDTVFVDLGERHLIPPDSVRRGKMLGRGAFGFVFKANIKQRGSNTYTEVAMKMLQPVDPGFGAKQSDTVAFKAAWNKWQRDPLQYACKAYCTARQELNILLSLRHQNIVPLVGVCTRPLSLVLQLAPMGALDAILRNYRRSGARLDVYVLQKIVFQIAKALEYLHQQHIIYRDLKSENVLVYELPPPFHPSAPIPTVETKLADYGISRSTLPTGTKGFGGTEGFMAPEIMRYNGEEEYTEKVDCFSFGMFMYELITLHQPFEGQECVKDHILEGGRPSLTKREMLYPTYILDLMALCWSQQPRDRPSASQIVSISQAPELTHLVDVVSLHDQMAVLSACVTALPAKNNEEQSIQDEEWELWLSRLGKQMDILTCCQKSWMEYKTLTLETVTVTCLCVVDDNLWLGDSKARVHIYDIATHTMTTSFSVDPHAPTVSAIRSMCTLPGQNGVALATSGGQLWLCSPEPMFEDTASGDEEDAIENVHYNIEQLTNSGGSIFCITAIETGQKSCELWCGQTQGKISVYTAVEASVTKQEIVFHYDPIVDNLDVYQLVGGFCEKPYVWSYVYPGCVVYQWDTSNRTILHKLDCSKLAPCSESLMSISIEEHLSPGRCQVTAMTSVGSDLYIGTTWGCIVVAEGTTMRPITVFRPFEEEVKAILPLMHRKPSSTSETKESRNGTTATVVPYLATVGKGYRNLIGRYTSLNAPVPLQDNMYLLLWRADNWVCG